jgi:hypothetical protein
MMASNGSQERPSGAETSAADKYPAKAAKPAKREVKILMLHG